MSSTLLSTVLAADPTVTFDLVHAELALDELLDLARQGIGAFDKLIDLGRGAYCALPFVRSC